MSGERDLPRLLAGLDPELDAGVFVFVTAPGGAVPAGVEPFATVREAEGLTLVLDRGAADAARLPYDQLLARITLRIHSDLAAVGLTAAVSTRLAAAGIACNVIAGYAHDHLLVPHARATEALMLLRGLGPTTG